MKKINLLLFVSNGLFFYFQNIETSTACSPPSVSIIYVEEVDEDKPQCLSLPDGDVSIQNQCERHLRIEQIDCEESCRARDFNHENFIDWHFNEFDSEFTYRQKYRFTLGTPNTILEEAFDDSETISSYDAVLRFELSAEDLLEDCEDYEDMTDEDSDINPAESSSSGPSGCHSVVATKTPQPVAIITLCAVCIVGIIRRSRAAIFPAE